MKYSSSYRKRKVVIVGAGDVGSTHGFALAKTGLCEEIVFIDKNEDLVKGQVLDLVHGQSFFPTVSIRSGNSKDYTDAQVIVITAGSAQAKGETRLDLLKRNVSIIRSITREIVASGSEAVVIVVSNPVDVLTYVFLKESGWERGRVIGSGTVLDSARFKHLLSKHCDVNVHNIHAYILGEHGDSEFAAWSMTHMGGISWTEYCSICNKCDNCENVRATIEQQVKDSAYHIIGYKGATYFAVAMALIHIVEAILRNQNSVLTVSVLLEGEYGLKDVCLSVPCIVSNEGVKEIIAGKLNEKEQQQLIHSSETIKNAIMEIAK
ncbi:MAG: L-lactate dehydrogenase [Bacteroidales bacterium]|nr:L-lactate dehydrogenase [Bacteroidales bacterium]MCF8389160.1 L-lactate dehydrogenase [Bacteroidales bacterium]